MYDMYGFSGPKGDSMHHFNFQEADDLFAKFFNNHEFDDDPFFAGFESLFGRKRKDGNSRGGMFGGMGGFSSMFDQDPFFKDMGMGGFGTGAGGASFSTFSSSSSSGGPHIGMSKSVSTSTKTVYFYF